jgi:hypothetical protein
MPKFDSRPEINDVARAILAVENKVGQQRGYFLPSEVRQILQEDGFEDVEATRLSSQIQPLLSQLKSDRVIRLYPGVNQERNRPYIVDNRDQLVHLSKKSDAKGAATHVHGDSACIGTGEIDRLKERLQALEEQIHQIESILDQFGEVILKRKT